MRTLKLLIFKLLLEIPLCVRAEGCRRTERNAGLSSEAEGDGSLAVQAVEGYRPAGLCCLPINPGTQRQKPGDSCSSMTAWSKEVQASQGYIARFWGRGGGATGLHSRTLSGSAGEGETQTCEVDTPGSDSNCV